MLQRCALSHSFGHVFCCDKRSARCEELPGRRAAVYMARETRHQDIFCSLGVWPFSVTYMCMYIYICIYIYIYLFIYICIICIYTYMHAHLYDADCVSCIGQQSKVLPTLTPPLNLVCPPPPPPSKTPFALPSGYS